MKLLSVLLLAFTLSAHAGEKPAPVDSTVHKVAVKDMIVALEIAAKQVTEQANSQFSNIQGRIQLLKYIKSDSISVPKEKP